MNTRHAHELFIDSWDVYRKIIAGNYMLHQEIYAEVERLLKSNHAAPFTMLDLGCGDASTLAPVLKKLPIGAYTGIDLSNAALKQAASNLAKLPCSITLEIADMLEFLEQETAHYDVIFSSFSLHHLSAEDKLAFLQNCRHRVNQNGVVIMIDVARDDDQDLPGYLDAYCSTMEREWGNLSSEEVRHIVTHVRQNDLPERISDLESMARQAGFSGFQQVSKHGWHYLITLS